MGYSTQQCLLTMLEKWKSAEDNKKHLQFTEGIKKTFGTLLTDFVRINFFLKSWMVMDSAFQH